jgi:hypothetical protein
MVTLTSPNQRPRHNLARDTCPLVPHGAIGDQWDRAVSPVARDKPRGNDHAMVVLLVWVMPRRPRIATRVPAPPGEIGDQLDLARSPVVRDRPRGNDPVKAALAAWVMPKRPRNAIRDPATLGVHGPNGPSAPHCAEVGPETVPDSVQWTMGALV